METVEQFSAVFRALSNTHRLRIFLYLARHCVPGEQSTAKSMRATVGELGGDLGIAPSTVSHHLKALRQVGLIRMERRGQHVDCWVEPETVKRLARFFSQAMPG